MRVAIHQPDLLPWSGFWFKMIHCDRFVLAIHDQLQKHWVQRRVMMRDTWVTLPLVDKPRLIPITSVEVKEGWQQHLVDSIQGRYIGARHWKTRGPDLLDRITAVEGDHLADINLKLIHVVRELLGIGTEILVTSPPTTAGIDRVLEQLQLAGATTYLSGTGARGYIDAEAEQRFRDLGIALEWSHHHKTTGDSVVTVLMDYDDPMEIISLAEPEGSAQPR
jgi:WbqC-like protein family